MEAPLPTPRLTYAQEFLFPALFRLLLAAVPLVALRGLRHLAPGVLQAESLAGRVASYAAYTWGFFFLILAGIILGLSVLHHISAQRLKRLTN